MRAPPESLMPMIGMRFFSARSMTLMTFSANTSPSDPPKTVASWLNSITSRPPILAMPVTTPSPAMRFDSRPKPDARWTAKMSSSSNELRSTRREMRSRAVSLCLACWRVGGWPAWSRPSQSPSRRGPAGRPCRPSGCALGNRMPGPASPALQVHPHTTASGSRPGNSSCSLGGTILAERLPEHVTALADRHVIGQRRLQHRQQVHRSASRFADRPQVPVDQISRTPRAQLRQRRRLFGLVLRAHLHDLDPVALVGRVAVHAHHDALARLDAQLELVRAFGDALLRPAALDAL